jgi:8-oxo-dGTP pyrophosphatase MutT (NUDIX family)
VKRLAMRVFARLPRPVRRLIVRLMTPSFTVGAVIALKRTDGALLLVEQRHTLGWALPGGLLERGESAADAVVREVAEEVGITIDPARLPIPFAVVAPRVRRVDIVYVMTWFGSVSLRPGPDTDEVTSVGWYYLDALPAVTEPTLDILRDVRLR